MKVQGVGLKVQGVGLKVRGLVLQVQGLGLKVQGLGLKVQGLGLKVEGTRYWMGPLDAHDGLVPPEYPHLDKGSRFMVYGLGVRVKG